MFLFSDAPALAYLSFWADLAALELRLDFSSQCAKAPAAAGLSETGLVDSLWAFSALHLVASVTYSRKTFELSNQAKCLHQSNGQRLNSQEFRLTQRITRKKQQHNNNNNNNCNIIKCWPQLYNIMSVSYLKLKIQKKCRGKEGSM